MNPGARYLGVLLVLGAIWIVALLADPRTRWSFGSVDGLRFAFVACEVVAIVLATGFFARRRAGRMTHVQRIGWGVIWVVIAGAAFGLGNSLFVLEDGAEAWMETAVPGLTLGLGAVQYIVWTGPLGIVCFYVLHAADRAWPAVGSRAPAELDVPALPPTLRT